MTGLIRSRSLALCVVLAVLAMLATQNPSPAGAAGLGNVGWAVSNSQTAATSVTYSWQFTPATTATLSSVTLTVPALTAGTPAIATVYGIGAGSVSAISGDAVTYTVTVPASIASGTPIYIELSGFTNTTAAGGYTSDVTTDDGSPVDTGTSPAVTFGATSTSASVVISKSMTVTNDTAAFQFLMDPGVAALSDLSKNVILTVKTNAGNGYTVNVKAGLLTNGGLTIPATSSGMGVGFATGAFPSNSFGYKMTATAGNASGVAVDAAQLAAGKYVGYTVGGETAASATSSTGAAGDTITLTNRVMIDYDTPGGVYTATITYTVAPSY